MKVKMTVLVFYFALWFIPSTVAVVPFHAESQTHCDAHPVHDSRSKSSWHGILLIKTG